MYDYYEHKHRRLNQDLRPWACCAILLALAVIIAWGHSCSARDKEWQMREETELGLLTPGQQVEVIRGIRETDQALTALDRVLSDRVEWEWREGR